MSLYRGNTINLAFEKTQFNQHLQAYEPFEFAEYGFDILDSEELTNNIYVFFVDMMAKQYSACAYKHHDLNISDIGLIYLKGVYIPCVKRISFTREIDLVNDGLPDTLCAANVDKQKANDCTTAILIRPINRHPYEFLFPPGVIKKYRMVALYPSDEKEGEMHVDHVYFGINHLGHVIAPILKGRGPQQAYYQAQVQIFPSLAMNACADSKYLWLAKCQEDIGMKIDFKLVLGLNPEHIKSLFYARSLPVTETGRKRPILHWVRAHQRRIKEGIEIDISTYLRGITEVTLDGLSFEIIQPMKPNVGLASITA